MSEYNLEDKKLDVKNLAKDAISDENLFKKLLSGIKSKDNTVRSNSFQALLIVSKDEPEFLYPEWDYFHDLLLSTNNYHRYIAIYILANLTQADDEDKFSEIFDDYFGILGGEKVMNASHVALNSPTIIKNKPELQSKIIGLLLDIENIHQGKQKDLVRAYVIEALMKIYPDAQDKDNIREFVKSQLESSSPKTRDMASCFLDRC
ncbi:MAG: hypothetical protein ABFC12_01145 [Methanobacterium sp.]